MAGATGELVVDIKSFTRQMEGFKGQYRVTAKNVLRNQTGLWSAQLMKLTPPKSRKQGRQAIENDLKRIMRLTKDPAGLRKLKEMADRIGGFPEYLFNATGQDVAAFHQERRSGRTGRTRRPNMKWQVGAMTFSDAMYLKSAAFKKRLREASRRIGVLKEGWLLGVRRFGGRPVGWVKRSGRRVGAAIDRMRPDGTGYLEVVNRVPWASTKIGSLVELTKQARQRELQTSLERAVQRVAQKFSKA